MPINRHSRSRSYSDEHVHPVNYFWEGNPGVLQVNPGYEWTTFSRYRSFQDVTGGRVKGRYPASPCSNISLEYYTYVDYGRWFGDNGLAVTPNNVLPHLVPSDFIDRVFHDFSGTEFQQYNEDAFNAFSTQFPEEMSFSEFFMGLRELKDLLPKLEKGVVETLASGFLQEKFGWDNLLSDLKTLGEIVGRVQARIEFLKRTFGKPTRMGWSKPFGFNHPNVGNSYLSEPIRSWGTRALFHSYRCDFRATATILQRMDHLDDTYGLLRGFMGALGLSNPLKVIWVNLPFSFVVDWFGRVSTHLDRLSNVQAAVEWNVYDVTRSRSETAVFEIFQVNDNVINEVHHNDDVRIGQVVYRAYNRGVGLPISAEVFTPTADLSPTQLTLLLAMFATSNPS